VTARLRPNPPQPPRRSREPRQGTFCFLAALLGPPLVSALSAPPRFVSSGPEEKKTAEARRRGDQKEEEAEQEYFAPAVTPPYATSCSNWGMPRRRSNSLERCSVRMQ
jgi:hypothetical protein